MRCDRRTVTRRIALLCLAALAAACGSNGPNLTLPNGEMRHVFAPPPSQEAEVPDQDAQSTTPAAPIAPAKPAVAPSTGGVTLSLDEPDALEVRSGEPPATPASTPASATPSKAAATASTNTASTNTASTNTASTNTASSAPVSSTVAPAPSTPAVAAASAVTLAKEDTTAEKEEKNTAQGEVKAAPVADGGWPRTLSFAGLSVKVFQPQLDSWDGLKWKAHSAVFVHSAGGGVPAYGIVGMSARTLVDKGQRLVAFEGMDITDASFPTALDRQQVYMEALRKVVPKEIRSIALDRLEAQLKIAQAGIKSKVQPLKNDPPKIIFSSSPALLVYVDGTPRYEPVKDTSLARVVNTRVLLLKTASGTHYLRLFDGYLEAPGLDGPWTVSKAPPKDAAKAEEQALASRQTDLLVGRQDPGTEQRPTLANGSVPQIIVATKPTELIVTQGEPNFVAIGGTKLLYAINTTGNVFNHLADRKTYVLLGGRWFRAGSMEGPWEYVPGAKLPKAFAQIPDKSRKENVKAAVPGTAQAQEALIENSIPTMAKISRNSVRLDLTVDGAAAQMQSIQGTALLYATNASLPLIQAAARSWYACQNGVWFSAHSEGGPWAVADSVPAEIYAIPPSSPLFYVTHVRAYGSTTDAIYYGYTPGYFGTAVSADSVVVFGTGYRTSPASASYWYLYPVTYGIGANLVWNPWNGWTYSYGFGWGWSYSWYPAAPWWGPYHAWAAGAYGGAGTWGPGGWANTNANLYGRRTSDDDLKSLGGGQRSAPFGEAYNSVTGTLISGQKGAVENVFSGNAVTSESGGSPDDNVFAAKDGGVYMRQSDGGWQQVAPGIDLSNSGTALTVQPPSSLPKPGVPPGLANPLSLDSQNTARGVGDLRANTFRATRPPSGGASGVAVGQ